MDLFPKQILDPETEIKVNAVEVEYQSRKSTLIEQYRILGARVRNKGDDFTVEMLRNFEQNIFDPEIKSLSMARDNQKKVHIDSAIAKGLIDG